MLEPSWCSHSPPCERLSFSPNYFSLRSMSDYSTNLSNESPPWSSTVTPIIVDQPDAALTGPGRAAIPPPVSPQTAVNILTQDLPAEQARDIARGLVTTIQHRDTIHRLEADALSHANEKLKEKIATLEAKVAHYHEDPLCPDGFLANTGQVTATIPIGVGYARPAKWIRQRDEGQVELLAGEDHNEVPYITDLYADPFYDLAGPVEALPSWFFFLLNVPTPSFHTLRSAVAELDNWGDIAEVERYRHLDDTKRELDAKLDQVRAQLFLAEERLQACRHRVEAARISDKVGHLEGRAHSRFQLGRKSQPRNRTRFNPLRKRFDSGESN